MQTAVGTELASASEVMGTRGSDPEVVPKAKRRQFSAAYRLSILKKAEACKEPGAIAELLRREGLYSSYLTAWRRQQEEGSLRGLTPKKRGRKGPTRADLENLELRKENKRLQDRLRKVEGLLDLQKKAFEILGESPPVTDKGDDGRA